MNLRDLSLDYETSIGSDKSNLCVYNYEYIYKYYTILLFICSLIKMLYAMCKASKQEPTDQQLEHAIKRNFGGYDKFDTYKVFQKHLGIKTSSSSKSLVKSVSTWKLYIFMQ